MRLLILLLLTLASLHLPADEAPPPSKLPADAAKLIAKADADIVVIRRALVAALQKSQEAATKKGDLDGALACKARIADIEKDLPAKVAPPTPEAHASKDVILYAADNYAGPGTMIRTFNTVIDAVAVGFPNDGLRSIKVPAGVTVIVYENELGGGASMEITHDEPMFTNKAALGMSSFKLVRSP